jgi:hypothetical protein
MALVEFVKDKRGDAGQRRVFLHLAQQNALGDVEDAGVLAGDVFEAVLETDFAAEGDVAFLRDALGEHARGEAAGLEDDDAARAGELVVEEVLRDLGRFAGTSGGLKDDAVLRAQDAGEIGAEPDDGEGGGGSQRDRINKINRIGEGKEGRTKFLNFSK